MNIKRFINNLPYRVFRTYMRFVHNTLYYRNVYLIDEDNIPEYGTPILVAANHQNALNDPVALHFAFHQERVNIFARGDIFEKKFLAKFFGGLGMLPAYRMRVDGEEKLSRNYDVFKIAGDRLTNGEIVAIFPEAVNQDKHWLGDFSQGYLRMAFEAAERDGFKTDIKVLPTALHYSNYFSMQNDMLVKFGEPVSLQPYYEKYKTKPRTVWREVNAIVRQRVSDLMLNITDLEHYQTIDYIRETYGVRYAKDHEIDPRSLPQRLITDKELCDKVQKAITEYPDEMEEVLTTEDKLKSFIYNEKLRDWVFDYRWRGWRGVVGVLMMILFFPLYIWALWPHIIIFYAPQPLANKFKKMGGQFVMFIGGIRYAVSALVSIPICYTAVLVLDGIFFSWGIGIIHFLLLPLLGRFAWYYRKYFIKMRGICKYWSRIRFDKDYQYWTEKRNDVYDKLTTILQRIK